MDTNTISQIAPAAVVSTFNAWHIVALGVGVAVTHVYHTVVQAGGVKRIWRNFVDGPIAWGPPGPTAWEPPRGNAPAHDGDISKTKLP